MVCLLLISQESKLKNVYLRRLRESSRIDVLEEDTFVIEINKHRYSFLEILTGGFIVVIIGMAPIKIANRYPSRYGNELDDGLVHIDECYLCDWFVTG